MYQVQLDNFNEDDKKILKNVKDTISIPESNLNPGDKVFIDYIILCIIKWILKFKFNFAC